MKLRGAPRSRVGVIGPNGAGKSTMIKLLTGETEPQEGAVYRHPALRMGYVSQHATHHIGPCGSISFPTNMSHATLRIRTPSRKNPSAVHPMAVPGWLRPCVYLAQSHRYSDSLGFLVGELLEKTTRVLTAEEKAQLEVEFVGKNGQKRKVEVHPYPSFMIL